MPDFFKIGMLRSAVKIKYKSDKALIIIRKDKNTRISCNICTDALSRGVKKNEIMRLFS